jgi:thiol-disulfide isomerase/thioredoxin
MFKFSLVTLLLLIGGQVSLFADSYIFGEMHNAYVNDRIELKIPHYFMDGKSSNTIEFINSEGLFVLHAEIKEPQLVFLVHNEDRLPIFLEPNDTLHISSDMFQFPLAVTFSGKAGHNNRLLRQFFEQYPQDFNEFNNLRYKIGNWWTTVEAPMDAYMNQMEVADFSAYMKERKDDGFLILDEYLHTNPNKVSTAFQNYLSSEILYDWAYHMLFYANVYKVKHNIGPEFYEFLYDAPTSSELVGSDAYRRFITTFMSYKQSLTGGPETNYADQYLSAPDYMSYKALAFFRSEIILLGLKAERYSEIMQYYTSFLQQNIYHDYDEKITDIYEKAIRVSPGVLAPGFAASDRFGSIIQLDQFKGKVVYLNFWASWCASCVKKMNLLDDFDTEFKNEGIVLVNVSLDENQENWSNAINENGFSGYHLLSNAPVAAGGKSIASIYSIEAVPSFFFIGKDGTFAEKGWSNKIEDIHNRLIELSK